jgi:glycosyltransferase involved in cell wall biosynthesis
MTSISNYDSGRLNSVKFVIAIPSYNEVAALPILIKKLSLSLNPDDAVLILDDSSIDNKVEIQSLTREVFIGSKGILLFSNSDEKLGRGSAVRRGMQFCKKHFPNLQYFIECDADGSHQVSDVIKLRDHQSKIDLVIGSRYLPKSQIIGWSVQRRIFSRLLTKSVLTLLYSDFKPRRR